MRKTLRPWICVILSVLMIASTVSAVSEEMSDVQRWTELEAEAYRKQDYETAFYYCELAAKAGSMDAQFLAAGYCFYGVGTEQSFERAAEYFQMAADQGDSRSQV